MTVLSYNSKHHQQIIMAAVDALKHGKAVVYPTDTSYGLAVDATNLRAIKKLYLIKERQSGQPMHLISPSIGFAKKIVRWNSLASKLAKKFWPGPVTLVIGSRGQGRGYRRLSAGTGFLGIRYPDSKIAHDLAYALGKPITTTSANPSALKSGGFDSYSASDVIAQFKHKKYQPDIIIDAGKLPRRKPSTIVKIYGGVVEILREGPVSEKQIKELLANS